MNTKAKRGGKSLNPNGIRAKMLAMKDGDSLVIEQADYEVARSAARNMRIAGRGSWHVRIEGEGTGRSSRRVVVYCGDAYKRTTTDKRGIQRTIGVKRAIPKEWSGVKETNCGYLLDGTTVEMVNRGFSAFCKRRGIPERW